MDVIKKKMAALREKLELAEAQAYQAEEDCNAILRSADAKEDESAELLERLTQLEDEFDVQESRLLDLRQRHDEAVKLADENERAHIELRNRGQTDNTKLDKLQRDLDELLENNERLELEYQDALAKLEENENILEEEEERLTSADLRVKELEVEAVQSGNLLRSMKINEEVAAESYTKSDCKLEEMTNRLFEMTERARQKEEEAKELEEKLIDFDDELTHEKERYHEVKSDYDALLAEVAEI